MSRFSEYLNEVIKEKEQLKIYKIAKVINCDRSWLQKVVSGDRSMNYEMMILLCDYLRNYLSEEVVLELYERFFEEYVGTREYQNVLLIKKRLKVMAEQEKIIHQISLDKKFSLERFLQEKQINEKERKLVKLVYEMKRKESFLEKEKRNSVFYAHFPQKWVHLRDLLLYLFHHEEYRQELDFRCVFAVGEDKENRDEEQILLENFLSACEYALYHLDVYEAQHMNRTVSSMSLMPYYILTECEALFVSEDGNLLLTVKDQTEIEKMKEIFREMTRKGRFFQRKMDLCAWLSEQVNMKQIYSIGNEFCAEFFFDKMILEKIVDKNFEKRELLLSVSGSFYETVRQADMNIMCSSDSLLDFVGEPDDVSVRKYYGVDLDRETRRKVFRNLYEAYKQEENKRIHILNADKYPFHSRFRLDILSDKMMNLVNGGTIFEEMQVICSPKLVESMKNFYLYLKGLEISGDRLAMLRILEIGMEVGEEGEVLCDGEV